MGNISTVGGTGGAGSDECTATLDHVLAGKTAVTKDSNDEPGTGRMTVNSLLSFSVAAYSGRRVLAKWQNPRAAAGRPYSGVYIRYSTGGYPGRTGGAQIYKGAGNNTASGGQSQAYLDLPALDTTYYLSIYPYVTCSAGELTGDVRNASVRTSAQLTVTIKGTQNYTIPAGFSKMDLFGVGGGGSGSSATLRYGGGGGGGGYTRTVKGMNVSTSQVLNIIIGAGGVSYTGAAAGSTSVIRNGAVLLTADKGTDGHNEAGGSGGSGGGAGQYDGTGPGADGGSDGGHGGHNSGAPNNGYGQRTTTRAFGEASGTPYAGGGGGGAYNTGSRSSGGTGGGGNGGPIGTDGAPGAANTGGGGGGAGNGAGGGNGGSGVVLIRLY